MCKSIATSPAGGYNGSRNIFFLGEVTEDGTKYDETQVMECTCSPSLLRLAPEEKWDADCES
jgi:hypothetical protein